ncbi:DUF2461 domain-containing protein [Alloacidobacterium dinghuense]|uniref:DUF2461 domain-containing protein n=1 Tax=Alloacidobacterium dinghuense TaxID=2763107 RepID=A0A7G8BG76_9BACT|nr:DUF2461 domain-containing protein [Alloacidobacterium dinghuense]QNI31546.1 DUF2461 domain-containing protein [Alloacidobacterium dinghuense]
MPKTSFKTAQQEVQPYFRPEAVKFLRGLKRNNNREWFEARRAVFERELKKPMLAVIERVTDAMTEFAPAHVRPAQKSMMRIYRDTRFFADKTPYKTHVSAWWTRTGVEKTSGGGYYFHFSPTEVVIAAGIYMPEREQLLAIRLQLLDEHAEFRRLLNGKKLRQVMDLDLDTAALTRPPKGFSPDHPGIDLIKQQQWGVLARLPAEAALSEGLVSEIVTRFRLAAPIVDFLNRPFVQETEKKRQYIFKLV